MRYVFGGLYNQQPSNDMKLSTMQSKCEIHILFQYFHQHQNIQELARSLHADNKPEKKQIKVAKIDGDVERAIVSRFNFAGFPSFFLIDGWSVYEYDDGRTVEHMMAYAKDGYRQKEVRVYPTLTLTRQTPSDRLVLLCLLCFALFSHKCITNCKHEIHALGPSVLLVTHGSLGPASRPPLDCGYADVEDLRMVANILWHFANGGRYSACWQCHCYWVDMHDFTSVLNGSEGKDRVTRRPLIESNKCQALKKIYNLC